MSKKYSVQGKIKSLLPGLARVFILQQELTCVTLSALHVSCLYKREAQRLLASIPGSQLHLAATRSEAWLSNKAGKPGNEARTHTQQILPLNVRILNL